MTCHRTRSAPSTFTTRDTRQLSVALPRRPGTSSEKVGIVSRLRTALLRPERSSCRSRPKRSCAAGGAASHRQKILAYAAAAEVLTLSPAPEDHEKPPVPAPSVRRPRPVDPLDTDARSMRRGNGPGEARRCRPEFCGLDTTRRGERITGRSMRRHPAPSVAPRPCGTGPLSCWSYRASDRIVRHERRRGARATPRSPDPAARACATMHRFPVGARL